MIVDYIESHRDRFGVEPICTVLSEHGCSIAPSTYYERRRRPVTEAELEDAYLANALVTLWREEWCVYGVHKLWHAARYAGLDIGRDQVGRLMRLAGIRGVLRGRHGTITTRPDRGAPRHPDLVERGWDAPTATDELWVADFVRHEALLNRVEVKDRHRSAVAAAGVKLRAARSSGRR